MRQKDDRELWLRSHERPTVSVVWIRLLRENLDRLARVNVALMIGGNADAYHVPPEALTRALLIGKHLLSSLEHEERFRGQGDAETRTSTIARAPGSRKTDLSRQRVRFDQGQ